ncbi:PREDICTED: uncharacterized protein LOC108783580 [Cyphomyrmex costatus]|uniref:uncharacterized protein LOC108783580 n=1 Tax=Cyphomyrmex costatus TaxID=456900 RepID=UPI0008523409|nr:PREDICTED: uncharacterized protein LOC108783580 [Cyphomyrmex costatus]
MEDRLKRLRIRRGQLKALCKRAHNTLSSNVVNELNVAQLLERKAKIEVTWSQFDEIQSEIEELLDSADTIATHEAEKSDFEETYYDIKSRFQDLIISRGATATSGAEARSTSTNRNRALTGNLKLLKIDLPSFSGSYEEWYPFHDTFQSLIHRDRSITEIQKFHYLKAALKGKAAELIQSLEMSADNYEQAWQMLIKRYDNKRLIIQKHLRALFELPTISKENFAALRQLVDEVLKHTRALKAMGRPIDSWDDPIIYLVTGKLDHNTNKEWEDTIAGNDIPTLQRLMEFLEHRCHTLEAVNRKGSSVQAQAKAGQEKVSALVSTKAAACQKCKENHQIYSCKQFLELLPEERLNFIKEAKLCWNCLKVSSHIAKDCKAGSCKTCGKRHNSLLHIPGNTAETKVSNSSNQITEPTGNSSTSNVAHATMLNVCSQVFLSTAVVNAHDNQGNKQACRILLDSGLQSNFITEDLVQRLGLTVRPIDVSIVGVNHAYSQVKKMVQVQLSSRYYSYNIIINCLVLKKITERLPNVTIDKSIFKIPPNLPIADPNFNQSTDIEVLLGAEIFWSTLCVGQIKETAEHPLLQKTLFGWVLSGRYPGITTPIETVHCNVTTNHLNLERAIERFWQTEQISTTPVLTAEERQCETHYKENHYRAEDGRFVVKLPIRENELQTLGNSYDIALKRFHALEGRLSRHPELKAAYTQFMQEYIDLGHMNPIKANSQETAVSYYMPHHEVIKSTSTTTKTRVVFDASCKTDTGVSLNDVLMIGLTLQPDLFSILIKFRMWKYVISGDVTKMYHQIWVDKSQRRLQRILWRSNDTEEVRTFELATVTYGTASASFLAIRSLQEIARLEQDSSPIGASRILSDFYVDDFLSGANSIEELIEICDQVNMILTKAGFILSKWVSNEQAVLDGISATSANFILNISDSTSLRTLGLQWDSQGPIITTAKILIQQLWELKVDWDESLPSDIQTQWARYEAELPMLNQLQVMRRVVHSDHTELELCGFADASEKAYGACVYVRSKISQETYKASLLCAKSRVAPLKNLSLPRLELCAALLLAQLMHKILESVSIVFTHVYYWSDSTIILSWIKSPPRRWNTFVANRVSAIQDFSDPNNWFHVDSLHNPADIISRELPEAKRTVLAVAAQQEPLEFFSRYSSFNKLTRVQGYILRFIHNCHTNEIKHQGELSAIEINSAINSLVKMIQASTFSIELKLLLNNQSLSKNSKLLPLNPFLDEQGIMRVGGRLQRADLPYSAKYQMLLPANHPFTKLLIENEHSRLLHAGPQATLASIRQKFWPLNGRNIVRLIIRRCIKCFRSNPSIIQPIMGNLPRARVQVSRPFSNVGVDFCGPFHVRESKRRNSRTNKSYVAIFVCLATKAVHVEMAFDLSAEGFIHVLRRFIGRRGKPSDIYSDNATNFIGADRKLKELHKMFIEEVRNLTRDCAIQGIQWHFIPPRTPHFGGIWEAAVRSFKTHFRKVVGATLLTTDEMQIFSIQIEAILNSRPISVLSNDPNDLTYLTPGHFLIGSALTDIPEPTLLGIQENRLTRWQKVDQMRQHLWKRWKLEDINVVPGNMVLVKEDNTPPLHWPIGRVLETHPGDDGVVRTVTIKTTKGIFKRPANRLSLLPMEH